MTEITNSTKKILSFDVGIKNLAYCLMEKKTDGTNYDLNIKKWNIINLVEDRDLCKYKLRTGNFCGKIARFQMKTTSDTSLVLCNAHKDKCKVEVTETEKFKCVHTKCNLNCKYNILNNSEWSWCDKHQKDSKKVLTQFKAKKITGQNCSQQPIQELAQKLFTKLDSEKDLIQVDEILIENQPSLKNPNMKTIASILYSYFVMRGIVDKDRTHSPINFVKFISPSNKLKVDKSVTLDKLNKAKDQKEYYDITKGLGKIYCTTLIKDSEKHFLAAHAKQDDLCDCFLQGFQYLFNPLPEYYLAKLKTIDQSKLNVKSIKSKKNKINQNNKDDKDEDEKDDKDEDEKDDKENINKENINKENINKENIKEGVKIKIPRKVKK